MDRRPPFPADFRLYLASRSPRRRELLDGLGVPFTVVPSHSEERLEGDRPSRLAEDNAVAKIAGAVLPAQAAPGHFVLGTDTLVVAEGRPLGKPADEDDARRMLGLLSGRSHEVVSGVALAQLGGTASMLPGDGGRLLSGAAATRVDVRPLGRDEVDAYLASGEWEDKAGAYAIQGLAALFIEGIAGEYANVVGLPVHLVAQLFRRNGFDLLTRTWGG